MRVGRCVVSLHYCIIHRGCTLYEKIVLKSIVAEFTRSGLEEATLHQVFRHMAALCTMDRMPTLKMTQVCISAF